MKINKVVYHLEIEETELEILSFFMKLGIDNCDDDDKVADRARGEVLLRILKNKGYK